MYFLTFCVFIAGATIVSSQPDGANGTSTVCSADPTLLQATSAIVGASNNPGPPGYIPTRCEQGPAKVIFSLKNEFYFPPIYRGSCDKLECAHPPCIARRIKWRSRCVYVFRLVHNTWVRVGYRTRYFPDHISCGCKTCHDIKNIYECRVTRPCPNNNSPFSTCYVNDQNKCDCCTPKVCPIGQIFNPILCKCTCPKGTKKDGDICVGSCPHIGYKFCNSVRCHESPKTYCRYTEKGCICPSCHDIKTEKDCKVTKCLERPNKLHCIYDEDKSKCRCPRCEDEKSSKEKCSLITCGFKDSLKCRFNPYEHPPCTCGR